MAKRKASSGVVFPTSIRLPTDLKNALKDHADEKRRSMAWVIVDILQQWYAFSKKQKQHKK